MGSTELNGCEEDRTVPAFGLPKKYCAGRTAAERTDHFPYVNPCCRLDYKPGKT